MTKFSIEMLPAGYGDSLWIEYGNGSKTHRILIDGGLTPTQQTMRKKLLELPEGDRNFELVICTHIDRDHIMGLIPLFREPVEGFTPADIWFNDWRHIKQFLPSNLLGPGDAARFVSLLDGQGLPLNEWFGNKPVMIGDEGDLPSFELEGGMKVTILGPTKERLQRLAIEWDRYLDELQAKEEAAAAPGLLGDESVEELAAKEFTEDRSAPNGSSIVVLLEYGGKTALLTGDAFPSDVENALRRWAGNGTEMVEMDVFKISHHGGKPNTSPELLGYVDSEHYLISTNGVSHNHPDPETIARILVHSPARDGKTTRTLHFNYNTDFNNRWDSRQEKLDHQYEARYPEEGREGIKISLL